MPGPQQELFAGRGVPDGTVAVNERCLVRTQDGHRVVLVAGDRARQYAVGDRMAEAHAMVSLVEQGWADQNEVARRSAARRGRCAGTSGASRTAAWWRLARAAGLPGRDAPAPGRRGCAPCRASRHTGTPTARSRAGSASARRRSASSLARLGWSAPRAEQVRLPLATRQAADPNLSAAPRRLRRPASRSAEPAAPAADPNLSAAGSVDDCPTSFDSDPADRSLDRLLRPPRPARRRRAAVPCWRSRAPRRRAPRRSRPDAQRCPRRAPTKSTAGSARRSTACAPRSSRSC